MVAIAVAHVLPGIAESMWATDCTASRWSKSIETSYAIAIKSIFSQDPKQNGFAKTSIKQVAGLRPPESLIFSACSIQHLVSICEDPKP